MLVVLLQWMTVMLAHATIAVSQKTADQILTFSFVNKNKIKVIYNGIDNIDFIDRAEARRIILGGKIVQMPAGVLASTPASAFDQSIWIGTISELHPNKGVDIVLTAFAEIAKKYPQTIFVAIGDGEEKERLANQITELGISSQAFLIGYVPEAERYLKVFDIFTLTSRTEALPYVILEAGLAELPIVASSVGGIPEIINLSDVGLLVPTGEKAHQSIIDSIEKLIVNPEYAKTLGQNLKRRVAQNFSAQKMHNETFALYQE
jgi:glycosyltransferase involved in cell wall biosynthesis